MEMKTETYYHIPVTYRRMENLHIVFWIFKDIGWCMNYRLLGIIMIVPTLLISMIIAWRTRKIISELCHNLAITVWISANSFWMCTEFFGYDELPIGFGFELKQLAMIPFLLGVVILGYYYIWYKPRHLSEQLTL